QKNDKPIKLKRRRQEKVSKGYYHSERNLVEAIKSHVAPAFKGGKSGDDEFKTIECWIMDTADDIAYSTYDLEDALKGSFVSPLRLLAKVVDDKTLLGGI